MRQVVLYGAPGCHLCEEAAQAIGRLRLGTAFAYCEVDIHTDPELERRYLLEIPVVSVDGVVVASGRVEPEALRAALR